MGQSNAKVYLPGSDRPLPAEAKLIGKADPGKKITVSIYARRNPKGAPISVEVLGAVPPTQRQYPTPDEFNAAYGADPADLEAVAAFAKAHNLAVVDSSVPKRRVLVSGKISDVNDAFDVELNRYEHPALGTYRGRVGKIRVPEELFGVIDAVFGLDTRKVGRTRLHHGRSLPVGRASLPANSYFPTDLARLYEFPAGDGAGQCVGIFAFNDTFHGGYSLPVLQNYFQQVLKQPAPEITDVVVHGQGNDPGPDTPASDKRGDATGEIMLDVQMVGGIVPRAKIVMYFTTFTTQGWVDAIHEAIADTTNNPAVISISYGNPEDDPQGAWTKMAVRQVNLALQAAAAKGMTVCCASGDDGSSDQADDGLAHADFPASSPFVLSCGGTRVETSGGAITREVVWNDLLDGNGAGGGGISALFNKPTWQAGVGVPPSANPGHKIGRGLPDVSGDADPETPVMVMHISGSHLEGIGGTSATAPMWAGLLTRINQSLGKRVGYFNPLLYTRFASGVLRDISEGNNGTYEAKSGWDPCTGLGSPGGQRLLEALKAPGNTSAITRVGAEQVRVSPSREVLDRVDDIEAALNRERKNYTAVVSTMDRLTRMLDETHT